MKLKTIIITCIFTLAGFIVGCASETTHASNNNNNFEIKYENDKISRQFIYITIDKETGVNYIIASHIDGGISITPRYNADGTLYISE